MKYVEFTKLITEICKRFPQIANQSVVTDIQALLLAENQRAIDAGIDLSINREVLEAYQGPLVYKLLAAIEHRYQEHQAAADAAADDIRRLSDAERTFMNNCYKACRQALFQPAVQQTLDSKMEETKNAVVEGQTVISRAMTEINFVNAPFNALRSWRNNPWAVSTFAEGIHYYQSNNRPGVTINKRIETIDEFIVFMNHSFTREYVIADDGNRVQQLTLLNQYQTAILEPLCKEAEKMGNKTLLNKLEARLNFEKLKIEILACRGLDPETEAKVRALEVRYADGTPPTLYINNAAAGVFPADVGANPYALGIGYLHRYLWQARILAGRTPEQITILGNQIKKIEGDPEADPPTRGLISSQVRAATQETRDLMTMRTVGELLEKAAIKTNQNKTFNSKQVKKAKASTRKMLSQIQLPDQITALGRPTDIQLTNFQAVVAKVREIKKRAGESWLHEKSMQRYGKQSLELIENKIVNCPHLVSKYNENVYESSAIHIYKRFQRDENGYSWRVNANNKDRASETRAAIKGFKNGEGTWQVRNENICAHLITDLRDTIRQPKSLRGSYQKLLTNILEDFKSILSPKNIALLFAAKAEIALAKYKAPDTWVLTSLRKPMKLKRDWATFIIEKLNAYAGDAELTGEEALRKMTNFLLQHEVLLASAQKSYNLGSKVGIHYKESHNLHKTVIDILKTLNNSTLLDDDHKAYIESCLDNKNGVLRNQLVTPQATEGMTEILSNWITSRGTH